MIIDAWAQHPTLRHIQDPIFDSLRRWSKTTVPTKPIPVAVTIAMMDAAKVDRSLISAWIAPRNVMISNNEVAGFVKEYPDRLVGVGSVDISQPMQAVKEIRRFGRLVEPDDVPALVNLQRVSYKRFLQEDVPGDQ